MYTMNRTLFTVSELKTQGGSLATLFTKVSSWECVCGASHFLLLCTCLLMTFVAL